MRLPDNFDALLRAAGLEVIEIDGWETRERPGAFGPVGTLNHHTGSSAKGWSRSKRLAYAKWMFLTGRPDLPAPLVQMAVGPEGEIYLGAAGRSNHAGKANASGSVAGGDGNNLRVGFEWMLSGTESIPEAMYEAAVTANAVTLIYLGSGANAASCHYQTSITGKWDIGDPNGVTFKGAKVLDVDKFRARIAARIESLKNPTPETPVTDKPKGRTTVLVARLRLRQAKSRLDKVEKALSKSKDPRVIKAADAAHKAGYYTTEAYSTLNPNSKK